MVDPLLLCMNWVYEIRFSIIMFRLQGELLFYKILQDILPFVHMYLIIV